MSQLPFELPQSLVSYFDHYREEPDKAIQRLESQVNKRGPDAVGYFLLAWLYHQQGQSDKAMRAALQAKTFAPGSPFLEKLHYYLAHPQSFKAWKPEPSADTYLRHAGKSMKTGPVLNLDALIERLAEAESAGIPISAKRMGEKKDDSSLKKEDTDDIASDTLANIHEAQGKTEAAIQTYERLKKLNRDKKDFYQEKIRELRKLQKKDESQDANEAGEST